MKFFNFLVIALFASLCFGTSMYAMRRAGGNRVMAIPSFEQIKDEIEKAQTVSDFRNATESVIALSSIPDDIKKIQAANLTEALKDKIHNKIEERKEVITELEYPENFNIDNFDIDFDTLDAANEAIESDPEIQALDKLYDQLDQFN